MASFGDVNARARGLRGHLLSRARLVELAQYRSVGALAAELVRAGYPPARGVAGDPAELDRVLGAVAAGRVHLLVCWLGPRAAALRAILERRELATLRAVLRGAAAGAAPGARMRGIHPSSLWPASLLSPLSHAASLESVRQRLHAARHPAAAVFEGAGPAERRHDLLELELAARRWWAQRVHEGVRRAGRAAGEIAGRIIDEENLVALLLSPAWGVEVAPERVFLPGGGRLEQSLLVELWRTGDEAARRSAVAERLHGTPAGRVLADQGLGLIELPGALRAAAIRELRRAARLAPLGPAPTAEVLLRIEAEAEGLRRVVRGIGLEAPAAVIAAGVLAAA